MAGWFGHRHTEPRREEGQSPHGQPAHGEIERRYGELINSGAFLYTFVAPDGTFLLMNRGMRLFLGPAIPNTLLSRCAPEQRPSLEALLREAQNEPVAALISLLPGASNSNPNGLLWMDAEFSAVTLRETTAVQIVGTDVTEWIRKEQKLASEAESAAVKAGSVEAPPEPEPGVPTTDRTGILGAVAVRVAVVNDHGVCLAANAPFILSFNEKRAIGRRLSELIPNSPENAVFHQQFPRLLTAREGVLECCLPNAAGEVLWLELHARPLEWAGLPAIMLTCVDVTGLRRTQEQLQRVTSVDYATGILNRQGMERLLIRRLEAAFREKTPLSLIALDIDGLHKINDAEGYAAADRALKTLAATLKDVLTGEPGEASAGEEVIGRWGGDEFMVVTSRSGAAARGLANVLRDRVHSGAFDRESAMTLSVGVAELHEDMDVSTFVGAAFVAMAAARRSGGNRTVLNERVK